MCEEWRDIPGFEGYYQASTLGRIRSVDRVVPWSGWGGVRTCKGQILTQCWCSHYPYKVVAPSKQGKQSTAYVHRLVAAAWLGPVPAGCQVRHGENGYADNSVSNLSYGTRKDNERDKIRDGTSLRKRVKRSDGVEFASLSEAAEQSDCHIGHVCHVCRGSRKSAGGYGGAYCDG